MSEKADIETGVRLIVNERLRQIQEERHLPSSDAGYHPGTLAMAAICYAMFAASSPGMRRDLRPAVPFTGHWPWSEGAWKPGAGDSTQERVRELAKAGALIAAEIDALLLNEDLGDNPDRQSFVGRPLH